MVSEPRPDSHRAPLLRQCPVLSLQDAVKGLFVCCVFLDYVSLSGRLVPELINFLVGILYVAAPNSQSPGELSEGAALSHCASGFLKRLLKVIHAHCGEFRAQKGGKAGRSLFSEWTCVCTHVLKRSGSVPCATR